MPTVDRSMRNFDGKSVISGLGKPIVDCHEMLELKLEAKKLPIDKINKQIESLNNKTRSYDRLGALMNDIRDSAKHIKTPLGAPSDFDTKTLSVTSSNGIDPKQYVAMTTEPQAECGSYTISNIVVAKPLTLTVQNFPSRLASVVSTTPAPQMFTAGTFQINGINITLNPNSNLANVANSINGVKSQTHTVATILAITPNSNYQLTLRATDQGNNAYNITDTNNIFINNPNLNWSTTNAVNASFNINDNMISRPTNVINDLIEGVTFYLGQSPADPATTFTFTIASDLNKAKDSIVKFVKTYNNLGKFYSEMNKRYGEEDRDENGNPLYGYTKEAALANDGTLRAVVDNIKEAIVKPILGITNSIYSSAKSLGIVIRRDGLDKDSDEELTIQDEIINPLLNDNFDEVRRVFEFAATSSNSNSYLFETTNNAMQVSSFTVNINLARYNNISFSDFTSYNSQAVSATPTTGMFTAGSFQINGANININGGDTLEGIKNNINAANIGNGIQASIDQNNGKYQLTLNTSITSGVHSGFDIIDEGGILINSTLVPNTSFNSTEDVVRITYTDPNTNNLTTINTNSTANRRLIVGPDNSPIEGIKLTYVGTNSIDTSFITYSQGLAERTFNIIRNLTDTAQSLISWQKNDIVSRKQNIEKYDKARLEQQLDAFKKQELKKCADMEVASAKANEILKSMRANDDERYRNN